MDEIREAGDTIQKMSPPMLVIVGVIVLNFMIRPFLPPKYLPAIGTLAGAAVAPYLFSPSTLAYTVPSPATALVIIGGIMGFLGSVAHRKAHNYLVSKGWLATDSDACPAPHDPPSNPNAQNTSDL